MDDDDAEPSYNYAGLDRRPLELRVAAVRTLAQALPRALQEQQHDEDASSLLSFLELILPPDMAAELITEAGCQGEDALALPPPRPCPSGRPSVRCHHFIS
jgi:hypothetical protein